MVAKSIAVEQIVAEVAKETGVPFSMLRGRSRLGIANPARHWLMWRLYSEAQLTQQEIADVLELRNRTSVHYGIQKHLGLYLKKRRGIA